MTKPRGTQRPRVIVVAKRSPLDRLERGEGDARARALLQQGHEAVRKWRPAHLQHERTLKAVRETLAALGAEALFLHGPHAEFDPSGSDLVITVGGDGTLLAASHSVGAVPILGINSAPGYSVGFFCAAGPRDLLPMIGAALSRKLRAVKLARMAVYINDQLRSERVLNEALFCHSEPAATSDYILRVGRRREEQKSSGLWIGPAAGSTAAIHSAGGKILPLSSRKLQFVVREPYSGGGRSYSFLSQVVPEGDKITIVSKMQSARVFLDGPYRALSVRLGDRVRFETSRQPLSVLGLSPGR
jgi:NAD+ kinase